MTGLLSCMCSNACQADSACHFPPRFQAHLDVPQNAQHPRIRGRTNACARHLTTMVVAITAWAHEHQLTNGALTILAIEPPPRAGQPGPEPGSTRTQTSGFAFTTIHFGAQERTPATCVTLP
jgi:hypothetical protein